MLGQRRRREAVAGRAQLVVGEGLETVLAAATRISHRRRAVAAGLVGGLEPAAGQLAGAPRRRAADHSGRSRSQRPGQAAAAPCEERWTRAGRTVVQLTPERAGDDFNDLVMGAGVMSARFRRPIHRRGLEPCARGQRREASTISSPTCRRTTTSSRRAGRPGRRRASMPACQRGAGADQERTAEARQERQADHHRRHSTWLDQNRPVEQMTWCPGLADADQRPAGRATAAGSSARM